MTSARSDDVAGKPAVSLLDALRRYLVPIVMVTVLGAVLGAAASRLVPERYRAESTVYLDDGSSGLFGGGHPVPAGAGLIGSTIDVATSRPMREELADELGTTVAELAQHTTVVGDTDTGAVRLSATADDGPTASATVEAMVAALERRLAAERTAWADNATAQIETFQDDLRERLSSAETTSAERESVAESLVALELRARELAIDTSVSGAGTFRLEAVDEPTTPVSPGRTVVAAAGGLLGLLVATGLAWRAAEERPRIRDRRDAQRIIGVPLVGSTVPTTSRWARRRRGAHAAPPAALHLGTVLRNLERNEPEQPPRLHVVGIRAPSSVGAVAIAVAVNAARGGNRIVVAGEIDEVGARTAFVVGEGTVRLQPGPPPTASTGIDLVVMVSGQPVLSEVWIASAAPLTGQRVLLAVPRGGDVGDLVEAAECLALDGAELVGYVDTARDRLVPVWRRGSDDGAASLLPGVQEVG